MKNKKDVKVTIVNDDGSKETVDIYVVRPNNNTIKNADRYRAKVWNQCIIDGVLTKKELSAILQKRGIWNKDKEDEQASIIGKLQELEQQLFIGSKDNKTAKLSDGQTIAIKMRILRNELRDLISEKISMEENTAEALSENAKFDYFVADCTFYEDGTKVFESIDEYNQKNSNEISFAAASALAEILYQIDSKFEENLPENKWLKSFNLVNDELSLINKNGELVDTKGRRIDKEGNYIDDQGRRIDIYNNLLNEDGTYVLQVQYEDDTKDSVNGKEAENKVESEQPEVV